MSLHSFEANAITGEAVNLSKYNDQVVLVVNVASRCGYTPQYEGLEDLYQTYKDQGFTILGFPCNQFGQQEPGNSIDILAFCSTRYKISFPLFEKIDVNGPNAHPLYQWLTAEKPGILKTAPIKWNFTKFLVGRDGQVIDRFAPATVPNDLRKPIEAALAAAKA